MAVAKLLSIPSSAGPLPGVRSMPNPNNGAKSAEKIPALIVFGRIRSSNVNQSAVFIKKDAEAAKAALDAGLSSFQVPTEEHQRAAAALPEGAIIAQARFSLSHASSEIIGKARPKDRDALDGEVH